MQPAAAVRARALAALRSYMRTGTCVVELASRSTLELELIAVQLYSCRALVELYWYGCT